MNKQRVILTIVAVLALLTPCGQLTATDNADFGAVANEPAQYGAAGDPVQQFEVRRTDGMGAPHLGTGCRPL